MSSVGLYRAYGALLCGALLPIVAGSRSSLVLPKADKRKLRKAQKERGESGDDEEDDEDDVVERLTREDAYIFPFLGSGVLLTLFLAFKFLSKDILNKLLGWYLAVMAVGGLARTTVKVLKAGMGERRYKQANKWRMVLTKNAEEYTKLSFTSIHLYALPLAVFASMAQIYTGNWILSNAVALSFSYNAISLLYLDSFATGSVLLAGLFLYDIWWVFGSKAVFGEGANVMVDVAKSFEAPIKIVFPKDLATASDFTLLGLGDVVLPGIFIALALRFDYHLALKRAPLPFRPGSQSFPKPYFYSCFVAYIAGLATTIFVMHTFRAAQPALLYLSPACVGSVALCAALRGEWGELWAYVDGDEEEGKEKESGEGKGDEEVKETSEGEKAGPAGEEQPAVEDQVDSAMDGVSENDGQDVAPADDGEREDDRA
ncbi:hypothetical protein Rhopal_003492-T1 [Rhodotorula paludigena]|uniref:Minor histocompatibility antigen H13 n=1 Tax=Rhodotorula paludigena TaxID=86838 RepID=A0AAV5GD50_9BASI|nr:hypothetical protein Rhopal_003492-T1 [Rhodotorula paludigena]